MGVNSSSATVYNKYPLTGWLVWATRRNGYYSTAIATTNTQRDGAGIVNVENVEQKKWRLEVVMKVKVSPSLSSATHSLGA